MLKYKCWFPGCQYETNERSKIDFHHIVPRELNPLSKVTIPLCKTCHALIYVPDSKSGQHSINTERSLKVLSIYNSTCGKSVHYESYDGKRMFYFPTDGTIWKDD